MKRLGWVVGMLFLAMLAVGQQVSPNNGVTVIGPVDGSNNVKVNCVTGCSSSTFLDEGAFTEGTTPINPVGGYFKTSFTALSTGQAGAVAMTTDRNFYVNLNKVGGSAVTLGQTTMSASIPVALASNQSNVPINQVQIGGNTISTAATGVQLVGIEGHAGGAMDAAQNAAAPANALVEGGVYNSTLPTITTGDASQIQLDVKGQQLVDVNYYAGTALGAPSNYGTSPGAVEVMGVNAFVTNTVPTTVGAGSALVGKVYPYTGCGTTQAESGSPAGLAAMPTSSTAIFTATTCLLTLHISNTTTGTVNITVTDDAGTPIQDLNAFALLGGAYLDRNFPYGFKLNAGMKMLASASGVTYYALGIQ